MTNEEQSYKYMQYLKETEESYTLMQMFLFAVGLFVICIIIGLMAGHAIDTSLNSRGVTVLTVPKLPTATPNTSVTL